MPVKYFCDFCGKDVPNAGVRTMAIAVNKPDGSVVVPHQDTSWKLNDALRGKLSCDGCRGGIADAMLEAVRNWVLRENNLGRRD